jgi:hypothetical protein
MRSTTSSLDTYFGICCRRWCRSVLSLGGIVHGRLLVVLRHAGHVEVLRIIIVSLGWSVIICEFSPRKCTYVSRHSHGIWNVDGRSELILKSSLLAVCFVEMST